MTSCGLGQSPNLAVKPLALKALESRLRVGKLLILYSISDKEAVREMKTEVVPFLSIGIIHASLKEDREHW